MAGAALLDVTAAGLPPELNAHILQHLGARLDLRQLLALCGVSRSARKAIERSSLALCFSRIVLGAGYGRWTMLLQLVAQRCPAAIQLEFSSCDVDSVAMSYLRSGALPALTSLRLLRCYHLRTPYDAYSNSTNGMALPSTDNEPPTRPPEPTELEQQESPEQHRLQEPPQSMGIPQTPEVQLCEIVALNLNVLDHAGFSLQNVHTLVMTGCESSMDGAQSLGLLNVLQHEAPQLRYLFLGGAKLHLYSAGRGLSIPQVQLCEMTFWSDELKLQAGSLLPNAKIVDLTDLKTLKSAGDIVANNQALPWDCAVECRGRRGVRPLHLAAIAEDKEAVSWLLSVGADCNAKDAKGCTALFRACQHGSSQAARHLLDAGADYLLQNQSLETPLYIASLCGFFGCVDALLTADSGPDRNQLARFIYFDGWSPLHAACLKGSVEVVQALLGAGFDACALNKWRQAPMHVVARTGSIALAELLYSHSRTDGGGAEAVDAATPRAAINQADVDGLTPVRIAHDRGHHAMVVWLTARGATEPTANEKSKRRGKRRHKKKRGTPAHAAGS